VQLAESIVSRLAPAMEGKLGAGLQRGVTEVRKHEIRTCREFPSQSAKALPSNTTEFPCRLKIHRADDTVKITLTPLTPPLRKSMRTET